MKLGIGTYCYMWSVGFGPQFPHQLKRPLSALGLLEKARALGVRVVQIGPNLPLAALTDVELDDLARMARAWGLELELATRGIEPEHLARQIALSRRLGCSYVRTIPEVAGRSLEAEEIPPLLRESVGLYERAGVRLGLENGKLPARELRAALEQVASPAVGVVLDTVNSFAIPEGWRYVAEVLAPLTTCLHIKDFSIRREWHMMGFVLEGRPAGQGQLDIPWLIETVRQAGGTGNVILEVWPPYQGALQATADLEEIWVQESIRYLHTLIAD